MPDIVTCRFRFDVEGDLLDVARVLRLLRRHRAVVERAPWDGMATTRTRVEGRVKAGRPARALADSLAKDPAVRLAFVEEPRDVSDGGMGWPPGRQAMGSPAA